MFKSQEVENVVGKLNGQRCHLLMHSPQISICVSFTEAKGLRVLFTFNTVNKYMVLKTGDEIKDQVL